MYEGFKYAHIVYPEPNFYKFLIYEIDRSFFSKAQLFDGRWRLKL